MAVSLDDIAEVADYLFGQDAYAMATVGPAQTAGASE